VGEQDGSKREATTGYPGRHAATEAGGRATSSHAQPLARLAWHARGVRGLVMRRVVPLRSMGGDIVSLMAVSAVIVIGAVGRRRRLVR
jgi:hypothetical protein